MAAQIPPYGDEQDWEVKHNPNGDIWFQNRITGQACMERPIRFRRLQVYPPEDNPKKLTTTWEQCMNSRGTRFYRDTITGVTRFSLPDQWSDYFLQENVKEFKKLLSVTPGIDASSKWEDWMKTLWNTPEYIEVGKASVLQNAFSNTSLD